MSAARLSPRTTTTTPTTLAATGYKQQDPHDEQLYEEIRACEHWQDVLDILADEGPAMSTRR